MSYSRFYSGLRRATLAVICGAASLSAQSPSAKACTGRYALAWYGRALGFSLKRRSVAHGGTVFSIAYPRVTEVVRGSPADSAHLRVGDELLLLDRWNLVIELDSLSAPDSLVGTHMVFRHRGVVTQSTVVPRELARCRE